MEQQDTVIFIHGAFVTPLCWRYFAPWLADRGYRTLAPAWPLKDRAPEEQLAHPDPRLVRVGIPEIVEHYKAIIRLQAKPPILIGHSFGGLIVQILLDQGFGAAGIAICSIPPRGASPAGLFSLKSLKKLQALFRAPFSWRTILPPPEPDREERIRREERGIQMHLVPESGRIFWQLFSSDAAVDFRNAQRAPLLIAACGEDPCIPAETQRRMFEKYRGSKARTDFEFFPNLTHLSIAEPGYEELAACCAGWIGARLRERSIAHPVPAIPADLAEMEVVAR